MASCYMPLRHSLVPTGASWLSKWQAIKALHIGVELRQSCVSFLLFFIVYMNWIDQCNQDDEFAAIGNRIISCLLCADDLIRLLQNLAFSASLNRFAAAYDTAGIKISTVKTSCFKKP